MLPQAGGGALWRLACPVPLLVSPADLDTPAVAADVARLLAGYHLATEEGKGAAVASSDDLPERYRREVVDPRSAFASAVVLVASLDAVSRGCVVVSPVASDTWEIKRLWVESAARSLGAGRALVAAALDQAVAHGATRVRLSVWNWRPSAIALYERVGFSRVPSWDERADLVCMEWRPAPSRGV